MLPGTNGIRACIPNPNKKHYITQRRLRKVAILDIPGAKETQPW